MKTRKLFLILAIIAIFLSGCLVRSIHPLYTEKDLILVPEIVGKWLNKDGDEYIFIKKEKGKSYSFIHINKKNVGKMAPVNDTAYMDAHFLKLGGQIFMDLFPGDNEQMDKLQTTLAFHLVGIHSFYKILIVDGKPQIQEMDDEWLEKMIKSKRIRIKHERLQSDDGIVLTASTKELQKFMTKYANEEKAFKKPDILSPIQE